MENFDLNNLYWMDEGESGGQFFEEAPPMNDFFNEIEGFDLNRPIERDDFGLDVNEESPNAGDMQPDENNGAEKIHVPEVGMEFDTIEMVDAYWRHYARQIGFDIRIRGSNYRKKTKELTSRTYVCNKEGEKGDDTRRVNSKPLPISRCLCPVKLVVNFNSEKKKFIVSAFIGDHSHPIMPKKFGHLLKLNRSINPMQASAIDVCSRSGFGPTATHRYMSTEAGGSDLVGFTIEDIKSHLRTKRKKNLKSGEATAVLAYFDKQSNLCPSFYRRLQFDNEGQISNFFWADSKMLVDFQAFGDVLTFDTTFGTNNESRPLGIFTGYNNHKQTIIFGGALLYDETAASFAWVFQMFVECHGGKLPGIIFTDQDAAMKKALELVMPSVRHGLCCWHISQNAMKHLSKILGKRWENFNNEFHACMYGYLDIGMFEEKWSRMLDTFKLIGNEWLENLFKKRSQWCIAYLKDIFTAGIRTTQLSESVNGRLKDILTSGMSMEKFFIGFDLFLSRVRDKELVSDCRSQQTTPHLAAQSSRILRHASRIYTPNIYKLFYTEWNFEHGILLAPYWDSIAIPHLRIATDNGKLYEVSFDMSTMTATCNCCMYEMCGYLCRHILRVFNMYDVHEIPEKYILKRWTLQAKSDLVSVVTPSADLTEKQRYENLCSLMEKLARRACGKDVPMDIFISLIIIAGHKFLDRLGIKDGNNEDGLVNEDTPTAVVPNLKKKDIKKSGRKRRFLSCTEKGKRKSKATPVAARATQTQPQTSQFSNKDEDLVVLSL